MASPSAVVQAHACSIGLGRMLLLLQRPSQVHLPGAPQPQECPCSPVQLVISQPLHTWTSGHLPPLSCCSVSQRATCGQHEATRSATWRCDEASQVNGPPAAISLLLFTSQWATCGHFPPAAYESTGHLRPFPRCCLQGYGPPAAISLLLHTSHRATCGQLPYQKHIRVASFPHRHLRW